MNPITGEKIITINGQGYVMRFTWRALSEIEAKYGDSPNLFSADVLSHVGSVGLRDSHPEMTPERLMDLSPPLMPFCAAVKEAIQWAYFGTEPIPQTSAGEVKKNRLAGMWSRLIKRLSRRE